MVVARGFEGVGQQVVCHLMGAEFYFGVMKNSGDG